MSNLFGNLLIKEMAIVVLCSGYTQNRHPPPPIQSISSAFTDEDRKGQISPMIHNQIGNIRLYGSTLYMPAIAILGNMSRGQEY